MSVHQLHGQMSEFHWIEQGEADMHSTLSLRSYDTHRMVRALTVFCCLIETSEVGILRVTYHTSLQVPLL